MEALLIKPRIMSENEERENRYRISQDDTALIRREVNKLTIVVGDLAQALRGNDLGNIGLIGRLEVVEAAQKALYKRLEDVIQHAKSRETYIRIIWGLICFVVGTVFMVILNRIVPVFAPKK